MRVRVASAGTGKTTSLVARYLALIGEGVPLRRIAGVTFTRDVADELKQRVAAGLLEVVADGSYLGGLYRAPPASDAHFQRAQRELGGALLTTIHGFMIAGIRLSAPLLGYDPSFGPVPEWEARAMFQEELDSLALVAASADHPLHVAALVGGEVALATAAQLFKSRSLAQELIFGPTELDAAVGAIYSEAYRRYLRRLGSLALAPGEVERAALRLLASATARDRLARRYPQVLVDEYQDVNPLQGQFFERLAAAGVNLEVVGDPKQSIYGFRSADVAVFRRALDAAQTSGDLLEPLTASRRHSQAVVEFLNRLTGVLGEQGLGFATREAPVVTAAGPQAAVEGRVDILVAERLGPGDAARRMEAELVADRLVSAHAAGVRYRDMAVVARQHSRLGVVERALAARGVPSLRLKGSAFYRRNEVRDVYHALRVGVEPAGPSLAAFLRGPFAGVGLMELSAISEAADPFAAIASVRPDLIGVIERLRGVARLPPIEAVKAVIRTRLGAGARLVDLVDARARANLDALLFELAAQTPADLELLLDRLDALADRAEMADVPDGGEGVRLLTMHGSKGLEFSVVVVFDTGASERDRPQPVLVDAHSGRVAIHAAGGDESANAERLARDRHESYRLLYVAASRARDHLIISGSLNRRQPVGWLKVLLESVLGSEPPAGTYVTRSGDSESHQERRGEGQGVHGTAGTLVTGAGATEGAASVPVTGSALAAPWIDTRIAHHPYEPLSSPSRLVGLLAARQQGATPVAQQEETEPVTAGESALGGESSWGDGDGSGDTETAGVATGGGTAQLGGSGLPGTGRVLGTLVHFAISQDWSAVDSGPLESLRAQEVMFPYATEEQDALLAEVRELLAGYQVMLGAELPALAARSSDRAELPLAVRGGSTVWEGVIDRLYQVEGEWFIDDYKTDRSVKPERYHLQLGLYLHAVERAIGTRPRGRLVYLRSRTVVEPADSELRAALAASGIVDFNR